MKKSFYNRCKFTIFCLLTLAFICISAPAFPAENEPAVIISDSGKVKRAQVGVSSPSFFPDRTFIAGN